jgi:isopentenyl-diphosphate Delta-isomerase
MSHFQNQDYTDFDPTATERKKDHIELAFKSRVGHGSLDNRFYYEPVLSGHPDEKKVENSKFLGVDFDLPLWISSMTGGTEKAGPINKNLAVACKEFSLGMGLGSCRQLLTDDSHLQDFQVRKYLGDRPLYANLGIAQIIQLLESNTTGLILDLLDKLEADGLIVHINPMQEFMQPEGDRYFKSPLEALTALLDIIDGSKIIVKEVGQGMGPQSLLALMSLPVAAVDFAAGGGTNFALLEILRTREGMAHALEPLTRVGHTAEEMVGFTNWLFENHQQTIQCRQVIISGGVRDFLDGYYLTQQSKFPALYAHASGFLKHAMGDYEDLQAYVSQQKEGYHMAKTFLRIKE